MNNNVTIMNNPLVSIVIPTYNDEKYISRCLDSIEKQTYPNYEVIVVLDGSTDGTKAIAESFLTKVDNISVVYQENSGAGKARNNGIKHSKGEYICFVDADDWLEPNALEILLDIEKKTNADYIVANAITVEQRGDTVSQRRIGHTKDIYAEGSEVAPLYLQLENDASSHSPWGKLFKRSIIVENNVEFPDLRRSQDIVFNNIYARYIKSIYVSSEYIYNFWNTVYTKKLYKDKNNRRNSPRFIQAEREHLKTMEVVMDSFLNTMDTLHHNLSPREEQTLYKSFLKGIFNNVTANSKRSVKTAVVVLKENCQNKNFIRATAGKTSADIANRVFAFFLRNGFFHIAAWYTLIIDKLVPFAKFFRNISR